MVGAPGFEPGASCSQSRRATRLRHAPISRFTRRSFNNFSICRAVARVVSHLPSECLGYLEQGSDGGDGKPRGLVGDAVLRLRALLARSRLHVVRLRLDSCGSPSGPGHYYGRIRWFLAAPVGQYQHVSIGLVDCKHAHRAVQRWSLFLATGVALLVALVSIPLVRSAVLGAVFGLDSGLLSDIGAALPFAVAYPLLYGHRQYY